MVDWPFKKQGSQARTRSPLPADLPGKEDFKKNDAAIKVWLPERLVDRLNWLSVQADLSRPDVIRALVFRHLYGEVGSQAVRSVRADASRDVVTAAITRRRRDVTPAMFPQPDERIRFSAARSPIDGDIKLSRTREFHVDESFIGASEDNLRLTLPQRMKEDIEKLARAEGLSPSECVRKLLVLALLGAVTHANWQAALGPISPDVYDLEATD